MAKSGLLQKVLALALAGLFIAPTAVFAADGKKHFKEGLKYEENRQWDKAAEKFVMAVAEKPSNIEYQLHLQRALVNAAVMLVERGDLLAEKKEYNAAYQSYRQAYAFDRNNEFSKVKMRRMMDALGLPNDSEGGQSRSTSDPNVKAKYTGKPAVRAIQIPATRKFQKTNVIARDPTPLMSFIEQIGQTIGLNVVFDQQVINQVRSQKIQIELRDVTYPKALEIILKTNNLMYAQLDSRTIVIALDNPAARQRYEPYAVRTFYIKNTDAAEVRTAIQQTLQTKNLVNVKQLNALIIRDTPTNLELIGAMIHSLDKSKAEVLIDVNIYEVTRDDMIQIGNQFVGKAPDGSGLLDLTNFGGFGQNRNVSRAGRAHSFVTGTALGFALGMPVSALSFFQDKSKAKLLASTQVHAFDNEPNAIRIGQRVPIRTATFPTGVASVPNTPNNPNNPNSPNSPLNNVGGFGGFGAEQIQYENVGLNIDVTPQVFGDEIYMKMKIESSSVDNPNTLTPIFSQRTMQSSARIKDGQPTLIAGVSQNQEAKSVRGIPIIGLIPILGRFFSTPSTTNRQSDVVITVTPHVLRAADITEDDHLAKDAGTANDANARLTLEEILYLSDMEESEKSQTAAAPAAADPNKTPTTVPAGLQPAGPTKEGVVVTPPPTRQIQPRVENMVVQNVGIEVKPPPRQNEEGKSRPNEEGKPRPDEDKSAARRPTPPDDDDDDEDDEDDDETAGAQALVTLSVRSTSAVATKGQDFYVALIANGNSELSSANLSLSYDASVIEVKAVRDGGLFRNASLQFHAENGLLSVQMERPQGAGGVPARGQLLLIIFTVKAQGQSLLTLNEGQNFLRTSTGQLINVRLQSSQIEAR